MKRTYLNLALLALVVGLGIAVWLAQKPTEKSEPLTTLKADAITRIALEHPGAPSIRLLKENDTWTLVEPVRAATDPYEVTGILGLAELPLQAQLDGSVNRTELQLDPPQYVVSLDDTRVALGGTEPIKFRRYVAIGERVGLVDDPPSAALDADFSDLISKDLVPEKATLTRIELPALTLEKAADGTWSSAQDKTATPAQLEALAQEWKNARALWNAADPPEGSQGDAVKLVLDSGDVIELVVQAREPQLVLARKDLRVRYTLSKALVETLFKPAAAEEK